MASIFTGKKVFINGKHGIVENVDYKNGVALIKTRTGYIATPIAILEKEDM